jgi:hypothetical protein
MSKVIAKQEPGLFDVEGRRLELSGKGQGLERLDRQVDWEWRGHGEMFRDVLDRGLERQAKGPGERPHYDRVPMFKRLVLQRYYNLSDDETWRGHCGEFQVKDRLTFQKFLGLTLADTVPDAKTVWACDACEAFREALGSDAGVGKLFARFTAHLSEKGLMVRSGSMPPNPPKISPQRDSKQPQNTF